MGLPAGQPEAQARKLSEQAGEDASSGERLMESRGAVSKHYRGTRKAYRRRGGDYSLLAFLRHVRFDLYRRPAVFLVDPDLFGRGFRQVDVPAFGVGAAVVNLYLH